MSISVLSLSIFQNGNLLDLLLLFPPDEYSFCTLEISTTKNNIARLEPLKNPFCERNIQKQNLRDRSIKSYFKTLWQSFWVVSFIMPFWINNTSKPPTKNSWLCKELNDYLNRKFQNNTLIRYKQTFIKREHLKAPSKFEAPSLILV